MFFKALEIRRRRPGYIPLPSCVMEAPSIKWAYDFVSHRPELKTLKPTLLDPSRILAML
jgi:hypothetical protein